MYYGFAEGDQIVFNFTEIDGKELKEIEILEYPSTSKFMDYKTLKVENKKIQVPKTAIYKFRFSNSNLLAHRICKVKIERIPASEATKAFNTGVKWETVADTSWNSYTKDVVVGYDTLRLQKTRRALVKSDTIEDMVIDKGETIHSVLSSSGNKATIVFNLPMNTESHLDEKEVIGWAYWVGVGPESGECWKKNVTAVTKIASKVTSSVFSPLAGLAVGLMGELLIPTVGEDVLYELMDPEQYALFRQNYQYRVWDSGRGIAGYKHFTSRNLLQGGFYIHMLNDNEVTPIEVNIKVSAVVEHKIYRDEPYVDLQITPRSEKQIMRDPIVKNHKVPTMEK